MIRYNYSKLQNLISEISWFFKMESKDGRVIHKRVYEFCEFYTKKYKMKSMIQPKNIAAICKKMCEIDLLSVLQSGTTDTHNSYLSIISEEISFEEWVKRYEIYIKMRVFGFSEIVEYYKNLVLPILYINNNDDISVGSSFLLHGGIVTAKHCVEGASKLSIKNVSKEQLEKARFLIHKNPNMDLMFIEIDDFHYNLVDYISEPNELDQIVTIGFPKIPGFTHFQTKEKGYVSSLPSSRLSKSLGSISAIAQEIFVKEQLFLITAKISGGNSGGPVINDRGEIIGVSVQQPVVKSTNYDDLGYGVAIPIEHIIDIRQEKGKLFDTTSISFENFVE